MNKFLPPAVIVIIIIQSCFAQINFDNPRIGIVISRTSFEHLWGVTQMSAHGWGGVVNLAGIPYDCFFIEDLSVNRELKKYDCLIFAQCAYITNSTYEKIYNVLEKYLAGGGNLIIDGPFGHYDENTGERDHSKLDHLLGIKFTGFEGGTDFRIKVKNDNHFITKNFQRDEFITQHLAGGLNIQSFENGGTVLLELTDEREFFPFLSVRNTSESRIVLVNDFGTWSGVSSFFRNVHPQVFYKNKIYNVFIESLYWAVYNANDKPIPSLQVTNADVTAIVRLDADASGNLNAQIRTINYLIDVARETGVVPVYAWVASTAASAGWQDLAPLGKRLEGVGGQIGTHSKYHNIDQNMNDQRWKEELDDAIHEIEFNMADYGYDIGKVDCFINPGNTIHMSDYGQIAKRFGFYMTHGFEQDVPVGFGNFTWFNEDYKNFVVLENTPSPDYQWFYDPTWSYTTQQITAYEESIFDHLYNNIGRGVIFNQMWHDYSITSQPQYGKDRIINQNNIAMYDAVKTKFKNSNIYCPEPEDLRYKLCIMAQSDYSWAVNGDEIDFRMEMGNVALDSVFAYTGGMGIRINNSSQKISKVFIDGNEHFAFNDNVVVLPNLSGTSVNVKIILSGEVPDEPHLVYISKRLPAIKKDKDDLIFDVRTVNRAKFNFKSPEGYLPLNTDGFRYNEQTGEMECYATSDRTVTLKKLLSKGLSFPVSTVRISGIAENEDMVAIKLSSSLEKTADQLKISSVREISTILLDNRELTVINEGDSYPISIDPFEGEKELIINFK